MNKHLKPNILHFLKNHVTEDWLTYLALAFFVCITLDRSTNKVDNEEAASVDCLVDYYNWLEQLIYAQGHGPLCSVAVEMC